MNSTCSAGATQENTCPCTLMAWSPPRSARGNWCVIQLWYIHGAPARAPSSRPSCSGNSIPDEQAASHPPAATWRSTMRSAAVLLRTMSPSWWALLASRAGITSSERLPAARMRRVEASRPGRSADSMRPLAPHSCQLSVGAASGRCRLATPATVRSTSSVVKRVPGIAWGSHSRRTCNGVADAVGVSGTSGSVGMRIAGAIGAGSDRGPGVAGSAL
ncbi:hypothetical protein D3C72_1375690 [compost metagenome]